MLFGNYSIPNIVTMYKNPRERVKLQNYLFLLLVGFVLWFTALAMLYYYWDRLAIWAKAIGIFGLLYNGGGPLITIAAIWIGTLDDDIFTNRRNSTNSIPKVYPELPVGPATSSGATSSGATSSGPNVATK
jgi:hypothetical protein